MRSHPTRSKSKLSTAQYVEGILAHNKTIFSRAITLIESNLPEHRTQAEDVLEQILPYSGKSIRLGITGVPGVGKSTFIEALGKLVTAENKKLAVLAIDPSSPRSRGSIMGDKTRMEELAIDPLAFIRPSPARNSLGGVAHKTRETMLLCEAAGYEVIFVETVGVGQSETLVKGMVDFFLLLMLAGAGDELQGIKKGIMEMADAIAINKADGDNLHAVRIAKSEYEGALHLFPASESGWHTEVLTCSALHKTGIEEIWELIKKYHKQTSASGFLHENRQRQHLEWMHQTIRHHLENYFYENKKIQEILSEIEGKVKKGSVPPIQAAYQLLRLYQENIEKTL
jgi:LAO/AO transport system kinase